MTTQGPPVRLQKTVQEHPTALLPPPLQLTSREFSHNSHHIQELRHKQVRCTSSTRNRLVTELSSRSSMVFSIQQAIVSRLDPSNLSSSRDMASSQLPRHQRLAFLVSLNNCPLNRHSSTSRALILHILTLPQLLSLLIILWPLPHNLEWLQANLPPISQDQVSLHLLEVP